MALHLHDQVHRSEALYWHKLHCILLIANGFSCGQVAVFMGDSPRIVEEWFQRYANFGLDGIRMKLRKGRENRLNVHQFARISEVLRYSPKSVGLRAEKWSGRCLADWIGREWGVSLSPRQSQRILRKLRIAKFSTDPTEDI